MDDGDAQVQAFYEDNAPEGSAAWMWLPPRWKALWRRAHQLETVFAQRGPYQAAGGVPAAGRPVPDHAVRAGAGR